MGIETEDNCLFTLFFANDQVVMANNTEDMSYMVNKLQEEYVKWGLNINLNKTGYAVIGELEEYLFVGTEKIQSCDKYKYLVTFIAED